MTAPPPAAAELDDAVRAACQRGAPGEGSAMILRALGREIGAYLGSIVRSGADDVAETFSMWCEDLVRGLPGFRFGASVRTWAYTLARHAAVRRARGDRRRGRRLELPGELADLAAAARTATVEYLRTQVKDRLAEVRASLSDEERELLYLRVDRQLPWREIARILAQDEAALEAAALQRREQALRKRFETLKRRLKDRLANGS